MPQKGFPAVGFEGEKRDTNDTNEIPVRISSKKLDNPGCHKNQKWMNIYSASLQAVPGQAGGGSFL